MDTIISFLTNLLAWVVRIVEQPQVAFDHDLHQLFELDFRHPAEFCPGLGRIPQQLFHFCRTKIARINPHDGFSGLVTGYKYPLESMKKELSLSSEGRPSPSYPHIPEEVASKEGTLAGRFTTVEDREKLFSDSSIPETDALRKGIRFLPVEQERRLRFLPGKLGRLRRMKSGTLPHGGTSWRR